MEGIYLEIDENVQKEDSENESSEVESEQEDCITNPPLVPVYDGKDINIDPELAATALSAISLRHVPQALKLSQGTVQRRNTFYDLHHPELKKLKWAKKLPEECSKEVIEKVFHEYALDHGPLPNTPSVSDHQLSSVSENATTPCNAESFEATDQEKNNEEIKSVNSEKHRLVLIMAPVQMQDHSKESMKWAMSDMRGACSLECQDGKRINRGIGCGEEAWNDTGQHKDGQKEQILMAAVSDTQVEEAMFNTYSMSSKDLFNLLHRSPAITNLVAMEGPSSLQNISIEERVISQYEIFQEVVKEQD